MCGVCAMSRAHPSSIEDARQLARIAALAIEHRGPHATGFAWPNRDGHPYYWKSAGRARDVVKHAPLPTGMTAWIGHTRWATKGSPKVYENNHPVVAPGLALVHNGVLRNDDDLFKALGEVVKRAGEVDSEALAHLLAHGAAVLGASHPTELLELVDGDFAIAWLDADDPGALHLARGQGRPMAIGWTRRGDLLMASTKAALMEIGHLAGLRLERVRNVREGTYLRVVAGRIVEQRRFRVWPPPKPRTPGPTRAPGRGRGQREGRSLAAGERRTHDGLVERLPTWRVLPEDEWPEMPRDEEEWWTSPGKYRWSTKDQEWVPR